VHLSANEERTKRAVSQIPVGALLFVVGALVGVALATMPIRERVNLSGAFPPDFFNLVGLGSLTWRACLLSSPLYVWLARRWPIYEQHWRRNLALHFVVTTALVLLTGVIFFQLLLARMPAPGRGRGPNLASFLLLRFFTESLPFWAMIALIHAFEFQRRYRQREIEAARLAMQLAEARLAALTAQLHPHFLFNTLQGISTLMHRDVRAADASLFIQTRAQVRSHPMSYRSESTSIVAQELQRMRDRLAHFASLT
jgi:Histidine kinase